MQSLERRVAALERASPPRLHRPEGMSFDDFLAMQGGFEGLSMEQIPAFVSALRPSEARELCEAIECEQKRRLSHDDQ